MVRTLIKHEVLRTKGLLATIFGAALLLAVVGALTAATQWPLVAQFGLIVGMVGTAGILPAAQLGLAIEYWTSGYRRVGYFTQTLPVKGSTIYGARLLWGLVVVIAALLWAGLLGIITFMGSAASLGRAPLDVFGIIADTAAGIAAVMPWWGWIVSPLLVVLFLMFNLLQYYFAASIGSERRFNSMGIGGPILVWLLLYVVAQVVILAFMLLPVGIGVEGGSVALVTENYVAMMLADDAPGSVPAGIVLGFVTMAVLLVWRTAISWDRKVTLA